ncbi:MAG: class I SAM-dependent methyltransferase [Flavobacteriales bacterium]|nr:class I SAM-dependent methyltransferase [Flavobacteriales bacterium]
MILITYTTEYRAVGDKFERVANTMALELKGLGKIKCVKIESKRDLKAIFYALIEKGEKLSEFHFIGHSGIYGPMFGTEKYPEQFSPFEWKNLSIPFAEEGKAYFHCCRSARWFANFFAQTFQVETFGFYWYTTFSKSPVKFRKEWKPEGNLYSIGCIGRKSHGVIMGSLKKYSGFQKAEELKSFLPSSIDDRTYNKVAALYDAVFQDIKVREDEWNWMSKRLEFNSSSTALDIGCGNGALLKEFAPFVKNGYGVDLSESLLAFAKKMHQGNEHISFHQVNGPQLPFEDNSIDVATSLLSFRYLDWDPLMKELERVLKPNGKLLIIDMVAVPPKPIEYFRLLGSKRKHYQHRKKYPEYYHALTKLVADEDWRKMLQYNPIRSEHEMKWYLESRFPGQKMETINIGYHSRVVAFDTGPFNKIKNLELTYP